MKSSSSFSCTIVDRSIKAKQPNRILISQKEERKRKKGRTNEDEKEEREEFVQQEEEEKDEDDCKENSGIIYHLVLAIEQRAFCFSTFIHLSLPFLSSNLIIHELWQDGV